MKRTIRKYSAEINFTLYVVIGLLMAL